MGAIEKIIRRVLESPRTIRPEELCKLLEYHGYTRREKKSGGSHLYYYTKPGSQPINFPDPHPGKEVNVKYVRRIARLLQLEMQDDG